jgi:hypothetical protein
MDMADIQLKLDNGDRFRLYTCNLGNHRQDNTIYDFIYGELTVW